MPASEAEGQAARFATIADPNIFCNQLIAAIFAGYAIALYIAAIFAGWLGSGWHRRP